MQLTKGEYQLKSEPNAAFVVYTATFPVHGDYDALKGFSADVLNALNISVCGMVVTPIKKTEAEPIKKKIEGEPIKKKLEGEPIKKKIEGEPIKKKIEAEPIKKKIEAEPIKGYNEPIYKGGEPYKGNEPVLPGIGQQPQPYSGAMEERLAQLEAAVAQLTHFISQEARPETDTAPLQGEAEFS